jgi:hypothetical protein
MREIPESHAARWRRYWHLRGQGWIRDRALPASVVVLFVGLLFGLKWMLRILGAHVEGSIWWQGLKPSARYLMIGVLVEGVALAFIGSKLRRRTPVRWSVLALRAFVGEVGLVVCGLVFLLKAASLL